jgi:hypothetical protein
VTTINLSSRRAEKDAVKLAQDIQKVCAGHDMSIVACALMGVVSSLPVELAAGVCATVARSINGDAPDGNDHA